MMDYYYIKSGCKVKGGIDGVDYFTCKEDVQRHYRLGRPLVKELPKQYPPCDWANSHLQSGCLRENHPGCLPHMFDCEAHLCEEPGCTKLVHQKCQEAFEEKFPTFTVDESFVCYEHSVCYQEYMDSLKQLPTSGLGLTFLPPHLLPQQAAASTSPSLNQGVQNDVTVVKFWERKFSDPLIENKHHILANPPTAVIDCYNRLQQSGQLSKESTEMFRMVCNAAGTTSSTAADKSSTTAVLPPPSLLSSKTTSTSPPAASLSTTAVLPPLTSTVTTMSTSPAASSLTTAVLPPLTSTVTTMSSSPAAASSTKAGTTLASVTAAEAQITSTTTTTATSSAAAAPTIAVPWLKRHQQQHQTETVAPTEPVESPPAVVPPTNTTTKSVYAAAAAYTRAVLLALSPSTTKTSSTAAASVLPHQSTSTTTTISASAAGAPSTKVKDYLDDVNSDDDDDINFNNNNVDDDDNNNVDDDDDSPASQSSLNYNDDVGNDESAKSSSLAADTNQTLSKFPTLLELEDANIDEETWMDLNECGGGEDDDSDEEGYESSLHTSAVNVKLTSTTGEAVGEFEESIDEEGEPSSKSMSGSITCAHLKGAPFGWVPPGPSANWTSYTEDDKKLNAPDEEDIDNPGQWHLFSYRPKYDKKGYINHFTPAGAIVVKANTKGDRFVDVKDKDNKVLNTWNMHYNGWSGDEFSTSTYVRGDATYGNLKPSSRAGCLDVEVFRRHGFTLASVSKDPFKFLQMIFPITASEKVKGDNRMPFFSMMTWFTHIYAAEKGAGMGFGHNWVPPSVTEMIRWVAIPIRHGALDGKPGSLSSRWKQSDPRYDDIIAKAMTYSRFLQLKRYMKLNNNSSEPARGTPDYNPCSKYDLIFKVLVHNMNYCTLTADLDPTMDESTWGFGGYMGEAGWRLMNKPFPKGKKNTCRYLHICLC